MYNIREIEEAHSSSKSDFQMVNMASNGMHWRTDDASLWMSIRSLLRVPLQNMQIFQGVHVSSIYMRIDMGMV